MAAWTIAVSRDDITRTALLEGAIPEPAAGEAVLRVERVGLTANNVTYAVLGDAFRYWEFFPTEPGWGVVPLWGFAEVVASRAEGVTPGDRYYGYLPMASHLLVRPARAGGHGFKDASPHRAGLPSPYQAYVRTAADPAYDATTEDLQILYRPLFFTSFMLADLLADNGYFGADALVLSSASSKTAYGTAFLLDAEPAGLTSPANVGFTEALGCYARVLPYDEIAALAQRPTVHLDFSGSTGVRAALRDHLGSSLLRDVTVGATHQERAPLGTLDGARPTVFFAPDQIRKRVGDWGREGLDERFGAAWRRFVPYAGKSVDVVAHHGPEALGRLWRTVVAGAVAPREGHVVAL